jgi:ABC-type multidrug transport system fused ATPase/permease subunit
MNDRGLDLSATDILKAEIIGELPNEDQRNQYAQKWEDIEQELGRDRFGALFTHVRMIYGKAKQRRSLQDEFKEQVLSQHSSTEFIDHVLDEYYDVYKRVLGLSQDSLEGSQTYHRHLEHLRRLDNVDWIPPAMAFFHRNQQNGALLDKFTRDLERLAYSLFIRRANVNERINRYAAVLRDLDVNDDLWRDDGPLQLNADEKRATLQVLEGPIYTLPRVPLPLLLRVDSLLASAGATYNYSIMSIEHVLPQNPAKDSDWMAWFPEEDERTQWTHRLANLVLLSSRKNARASNFSFDHKKAEYFLRGGTSPFALTTQVVGESEWTPKVLKRRQSELIQKLKEEWRLA